MNKRYSYSLQNVFGLRRRFSSRTGEAGSSDVPVLQFRCKALVSLSAKALLVGVLVAPAAWDASAQSDPATEEEEVFELEAFNVYSKSQSLALEAKRQNDRFGSYLSSDAIGILPDDDLGDALSRLAGVNVVDSGVVIRGAEGKLNNVQLDGLSPSNVSGDMSLDFGDVDTRQFEVDQIPTELVDSIEVIKSVTADLDGDSVGGIVNVKTADSFRFEERVLRYKAEYRYKDLNGDPGFGASLTFADRLNDEGTMGVYFNASWRDEDDTSSLVRTDFNPGLPDIGEDGVPMNTRRIRRIRPSTNAESRQQLNFNGAFDWKISENTVLHFKAMYSKDDRRKRDNEVRLDEGDESWKDYDDDGVVDAELFLDNLVIDPVTNELITVGNVIDNNAPGTLTPVGGTESDYRQVEELRPIRTADSDDSTEESYRLMFSGETKLGNGGLFEWVAAYDESNFDATDFSSSWEAEAQENTRIFRAYWDQSDPMRPIVTGVLKDVPFGSGQALDDNWGDPDEERIAEWIDDGWTEEEAQKMLAAGITGENAPNAVDEDGSLVYWWELTDKSTVQVLDLINRMKGDRKNEQITLKSDLTLPLSDTFSFKTGVKFKSENRVTSVESKQWAQNASVVSDLYGKEFTIGDFQDLSDQSADLPILAGGGVYAKLGEFIDPAFLADFQNENFADSAGRPLWQAVTPDSLRRIAAKNWDGKESIGAGYLMGTYKPTPELTFIGGARYEHTWDDFNWRGSQVDPPLPFDPISGELLGDVVLPRAEDINAENEYGNWLPSALGVYRMDDHIFRAAYAKTLARPDFDDLNPLDINQLFQKWGEFFGDPDNDIYIYNPNLSEQLADNFDLAWEWYYADDAMISVTLFRKELEGFHLNQEVIRPDVAFPVLDEDTGFQEVDGDGNLVFDFEDQEIKFAANGAQRVLEGVEISFEQSFRDLLPAPFNGFGTLINYTYLAGTETNTSYDPDALLEGRFVPTGTVDSDGLSGQPEHIINAQLYWEMGRFSSRLAYNYVSEYDREVFSPDRDEIRAARTQIDVSMQYRLPDSWMGGSKMRVFLEGRNLNKEIQQDYDQIPRWTTYVNEPQREFVAGVRGSF